MRKIQDWAICIGLVAAVGACASTPTAAKTVPSSFSDEIFASHADGGVIHHLSGGYCPEKIGDFVLTDSIIFESDGTDVGCTFEMTSTTNNGGATVYFSRFGADKFQAFAETSKPIILERFPGVKLNSTDSDVCLSNLLTPPVTPEAVCQVYDGESVDTVLAMLLFGDWHAKIRLTFFSDLNVPASVAQSDIDLGPIAVEMMDAATAYMNGEFTPDT